MIPILARISSASLSGQNGRHREIGVLLDLQKLSRKRPLHVIESQLSLIVAPPHSAWDAAFSNFEISSFSCESSYESIYY